MNTEIKLTGGARIGWVNASWPFARLDVTSSRVILNSPFLGKYEFRPEDITSLEAVGTIPLIGRGIRIHHNIANYPEKVIFWTSKNPEDLIERIRRLGFIPKGIRSAASRDRGFPVRWQAIIIIVVLWNALLLLDMFRGGVFNPKPDLFAWLATVLVFIISIAIWRSDLIKEAIMSPGRKPSEIRPFLYLITLITGLLSLILGLELIK